MYDILTIGTASLDFFIYYKKSVKEKENIVLPFDFKTDVEKANFFIGGGAINTALSFKNLGFNVATYIQLGKDFLGDYIKKELEKRKIKYFVDYSKKTTAFSFFIKTEKEDDVIFVHRGASEKLEFKDVKKIKKIKVKNVYIGPSLSKIAVLKSITSYFKKNNIFLAWNPSYFQASLGIFQIKAVLNNLDVLILNKKELEALTNEKDLEKQIEIIIKNFNGITLITLGKEGSICIFKDKIYKAETFFEKQVVDKTGAGDAFSSAFLGALILKKDIKEALRWGSANATSTIEHLGANVGHLKKQDYNKLRWQKFKVIVSNLNEREKI